MGMTRIDIKAGVFKLNRVFGVLESLGHKIELVTLVGDVKLYIAPQYSYSGRPDAAI